MSEENETISKVGCTIEVLSKLTRFKTITLIGVVLSVLFLALPFFLPGLNQFLGIAGVIAFGYQYKQLKEEILYYQEKYEV